MVPYFPVILPNGAYGFCHRYLLSIQWSLMSTIPNVSGYTTIGYISLDNIVDKSISSTVSGINVIVA
jgi:hypothetical protein